METDVIKAVAEARYHVDPVSAREYDETCPCDMTDLRWPTLSRECNCRAKETHFCKDFVVPGRVPDVTLEKVFEAATNQGVHHIVIDYDNDTVYVDLVPDGCAGDEDDLPNGFAPTLLLALCDALLASTKAS